MKVLKKWFKFLLILTKDKPQEVIKDTMIANIKIILGQNPPYLCVCMVFSHSNDQTQWAHNVSAMWQQFGCSFVTATSQILQKCYIHMKSLEDVEATSMHNVTAKSKSRCSDVAGYVKFNNKENNQ